MLCLTMYRDVAEMTINSEFSSSMNQSSMLAIMLNFTSYRSEFLKGRDKRLLVILTIAVRCLRKQKW